MLKTPPLDPSESDGDSDGIGDNSDNCPAISNSNQQILIMMPQEMFVRR